MKKKHIIFLVSGLFIIVAIIVIAILLNKKVELPKLKAEDIERIYCDEFDDNDIQLDIEEFLGYYNQIYDIRFRHSWRHAVSQSNKNFFQRFRFHL